MTALNAFWSDEDIDIIADLAFDIANHAEMMRGDLLNLDWDSHEELLDAMKTYRARIVGALDALTEVLNDLDQELLDEWEPDVEVQE